MNHINSKLLNDNAVKQFESEQKQFGTSVAMSNLIYNAGYLLFREIGVVSCKVDYTLPTEDGLIENKADID